MADGDTIYIQLRESIVGYGNAGDIVQVVQSPFIDLMITNGLVVVVTVPGPLLSTFQKGSFPLADGFGNQVPGYTLIDYSENASDVATPLTVSGTNYRLQCTCTIPPSAQQNLIQARAIALIGTAGSGAVILGVYDITTGEPGALLDEAYTPIVAAESTTFSKGAPLSCEFFLNAIPGYETPSSTIVIGLYAQMDVDATLTASIRNTRRNAGASTSLTVLGV